MPDPKFVSVAKAANLLGVTPRRINQMIKSGIIKVQRLEGQRSPLIPYTDLLIVKDRARPVGRPKKGGES
jgi:excisionase family DNA binding protein